MSGRFIVLEGGDGAGKSSVQRALGERLRTAGADLLLTREPGGTPLGERIRDILLAGGPIDPMAELLLFEAARAELIYTVIRPALTAGRLVLCDRFTASSVAYQGRGRGLGRTVVEQANAVATGGLTPEMTLLLDLPVELGLSRRSGDGDGNRFDREALAFHERVRAGYLELAAESPERWRIVDASASLDAVVQAAWDVLAYVSEKSPSSEGASSSST